MTLPMKRFLRIALVVSIVALPALALAQTPAADAGFTPLTSIPFIEDAGNADTLPDFLNGLYKLCIGLAAALAVLQIMRAGVMYMGGDSVTEKKEARNLIGLSIGGLVLVLSPVIVFSIINPDILSLKIDGIKNLGTATTTQSFTAVPVQSAQECTAAGGRLSGAVPNLICTVASDSPLVTAANACTNFKNITVVSDSCEFQAGDDYVAIQTSCCAGIQAGKKCCAQPK